MVHVAGVTQMHFYVQGTGQLPKITWCPMTIGGAKSNGTQIVFVTSQPYVIFFVIVLLKKIKLFNLICIQIECFQ